MWQARFRLRINAEIWEADIVVGTRARWESSICAATPGWSINAQRGRIIAMRLVGGESNAPKNLDFDFKRKRMA